MRTEEQRRALAEKLDRPFVGNGPSGFTDDAVRSIVEPDGTLYYAAADLVDYLREADSHYFGRLIERLMDWQDKIDVAAAELGLEPRDRFGGKGEAAT